MELKGKNILITGGTSGIGYEMVKRLQHDNSLIVVASNRSRLEELGNEFENVFTCQVDLADPAAAETVADAVGRKFDHLDVLINNAAVQNLPLFTDPDFERSSISREIAINLTSVCELTALLLPSLMENGQPTVIVNVNSGLALAPKTSSAVYCATKAALDAFSYSLRYQLASTNVSVLQAFMPLVDTPMTEGRGRGKLPVSSAAEQLLIGIERGIKDHNIGKVKLLRFLLLAAPWLARRIMRGS